MKLRTILIDGFCLILALVGIICLIDFSNIGSSIVLAFDPIFDFSMGARGIYASVLLILTIILTVVGLVFVFAKRKPIHLITVTIVLVALFLDNPSSNLFDSSFALEGKNLIAIICLLVSIILGLLASALTFSELRLKKEKSDSVKTVASNDETPTESPSESIEKDKEKDVEPVSEEKAETVEEPLESPADSETPPAEELPAETEEVSEEIEEDEAEEDKTEEPEEIDEPEEISKEETEIEEPEKDEDAEVEFVSENAAKGPQTKVYHVNKRASDNKWSIKFATGSKVIKLFATKAEAVEYANTLAKKQSGIVLVHASKGKKKGKIVKQ